MDSNGPKGCLAICGIGLSLLSLVGLWQARDALHQHKVLYSLLNIRPWMEPRQALIAYTFSLAFGVWFLVAAVKRKKK
jgi:hypothetical protein